MLHTDQGRGYYGYKYVIAANTNNAVETLLITAHSSGTRTSRRAESMWP